MSLSNFSTIGPTAVTNYSYNPDNLEIVKQDGEEVNTDNIYLSITEPPAITNVTTDLEDIPPWKQNLNKALTLSMPLVLVAIMLGMGSHVHWKEVLSNFWPPLPMIIGMSGQFVILPALAYGLSILFKMEPYVALGCIIVSCSPGGAFSNFFTYWVNGDVALSLVMTTCSTILSFGTMPLNLWLYASNIVGEDSKKLVIPYKNVVASLGFAIVPAIVGMVIRHFSERIADKTTQIASIIGYAIVGFNVTCLFLLFWNILVAANWYLHLSVILLPGSGMFLAYLAAYISRRPHKICRTIAIETASQSIPVIMGIVALSFPEIEVRKELMVYPVLYWVYMSAEITAGAALYRLFYYYQQRSKSKSNVEVTKLGNSAV